MKDKLNSLKLGDLVYSKIDINAARKNFKVGNLVIYDDKFFGIVTKILKDPVGIKAYFYFNSRTYNFWERYDFSNFSIHMECEYK